MKKKFAVCFSGYPRFVKTTFDNIKTNFLDGLGSYDIYAYLQWYSENWKGSQVHHENKITIENNELEDFDPEVDVEALVNICGHYVFSHSKFNKPEGLEEEIKTTIHKRIEEILL